MEIRWSMNASYLGTTSCNDRTAIQSPIFYVCMILFLVAFLIPQTFKHYAASIRVSLVLAIFFYVLWGALYWCTWDVIMWSVVFFVQNFAQLVYIFYNMRKTNFSDDMEIVYIQVFQPFGITRNKFQALTQHHCKLTKVHPGDKYTVEGCASVDERVSLLVTGRMRVMYKGQYLHDINETDIIDSVEWEGCKMKRGELFQVTIEAVDRCSYLCWNREKLQYYLEANPDLQVAFQYIRGNDVLSKIRETALNSYRRNLKNINQCESIDSIGVTSIRQAFAEEDPKYIRNEAD